MKIFKKLFGFTLIEILISLSIFSIMAVICTTVLFSVFNARDNTTKHAVELRELQIAFVLIERDLTQIIQRQVTSTKGIENAVQGLNDQLTFSRGGVINPLSNQKKSTISRVYYHLNSKHNLQRDSTMAVDAIKVNNTFKENILSNVSQIAFQYIDKDKQTKEQWFDKQIPLAIRITIIHKIWGKVSQIYTLSQAHQYYEKYKK